MRTVYPFRLLFMSASIFFRKGSSSRWAATKLRIRINETDPTIQRNDLFVRRFLKRKSKFLRTAARSNGTFSSFYRSYGISIRKMFPTLKGQELCQKIRKLEARDSADCTPKPFSTNSVVYGLYVASSCEFLGG